MLHLWVCRNDTPSPWHRYGIKKSKTQILICLILSLKIQIWTSKFKLKFGGRTTLTSMNTSIQKLFKTNKSSLGYDSYKFAYAQLHWSLRKMWIWVASYSEFWSETLDFCVGDINEITCSKFQVKWTSSGGVDFSICSSLGEYNNCIRSHHWRIESEVGTLRMGSSKVFPSLIVNCLGFHLPCE